MTLHTRVITTAPGLDPRGAFDKMRELIGADETYRVGRTGLSMCLGQGLPALMWVDTSDGQPEGHDEYCEPDCSGRYHDPGHYVEINFDTAYGYKSDNGAGCGDLHAYLVREIGHWLNLGDLPWRWYDESGDGWDTRNDDLSGLGDPELGRIPSLATA